VITHPADELVEDIEPVDPEGKYGPAKRRPVAEGIVRRAPLLRCQADPLGSGRRRRAGHAPRARRLARLRSLRHRLRLVRLRGLFGHECSSAVAGRRVRPELGLDGDRLRDPNVTLGPPGLGSRAPQIDYREPYLASAQVRPCVHYPVGTTASANARASDQQIALQKLNCQDFDDVGVVRRVVVTGLAGGATAEV
jgi:hypothetical protein